HASGPIQTFASHLGRHRVRMFESKGPRAAIGNKWSFGFDNSLHRTATAISECQIRSTCATERAYGMTAAMIHVCSLARLHQTVADIGARHVVSLVGDEASLVRPPQVTP